jgi:uncharacterized membrane protein HdeD (DUF308 family)
MSALKYLGVLILLAGVAVIVVPILTEKPNNTYLLVGLLMVIGGYLGHIFLNRKIQ